MWPFGGSFCLQKGPSGARSARVIADEVRPETEQRAHREADDVEVVAVDALDQRAAAALDRVAAGALFPLAALEIPLDHAVVERPERDLRDRGVRAHRPVLVEERDAADDVVRAAREVAQRLARGVLVGRLAPDL